METQVWLFGLFYLQYRLIWQSVDYSGTKVGRKGLMFTAARTIVRPSSYIISNAASQGETARGVSCVRGHGAAAPSQPYAFWRKRHGPRRGDPTGRPYDRPPFPHPAHTTITPIGAQLPPCRTATAVLAVNLPIICYGRKQAQTCPKSVHHPSLFLPTSSLQAP